MSQKKYQIFISSTYEDLKEERRAVEEAIIRSGDIPVGMEVFPAADNEQFEFIKSVIDQCDYYILLVAGRYGSVADDGVSYTEKEFNYAVENGIPVLAFLHDDPEGLPSNRTEKTTSGKRGLEKFKAKVSTNRMRKNWRTIDGLKLAVREALDYAKATKIRPGWVRGTAVLTTEALQELESLRRENSELRENAAMQRASVLLPGLPALEDKIVVTFQRFNKESEDAWPTVASVKGDWLSFYEVFYRTLEPLERDGIQLTYHEAERVCGQYIALDVKIPLPDEVEVSRYSMRTLVNYFLEYGFLEEHGEVGRFTELGHKAGRRLTINEYAHEAFELLWHDDENSATASENIVARSTEVGDGDAAHSSDQ